jgi:hypothetical protein
VNNLDSQDNVEMQNIGDDADKKQVGENDIDIRFEAAESDRKKLNQDYNTARYDEENQIGDARDSNENQDGGIADARDSQNSGNRGSGSGGLINREMDPDQRQINKMNRV